MCFVLYDHQAYPKSHHPCFVGSDWHKVVGDDGHGVVVNREALDTFGAGIYKAKTVPFARYKVEGG